MSNMALALRGTLLMQIAKYTITKKGDLLPPRCYHFLMNAASKHIFTFI